MSKQDIVDKILIKQRDIIFTLRVNIEYIKEIRKKAADKDDIVNNRALNYIGHLAIRDSFICIHKLLHHKEDFSFDKLISRVINSNETLLKNDKFVIGQTELKKLKKEFEQLNLKEIRDKYIAHSDLSPESYSYNWAQLFEFIEKVSKVFNHFHSAIRDSSVYWDESHSLKEVIHEISILRAIQKLKRDKVKKSENAITLGEIEDIFKQQYIQQ